MLSQLTSVTVPGPKAQGITVTAAVSGAETDTASFEGVFSELGKNSGQDERNRETKSSVAPQATIPSRTSVAQDQEVEGEDDAAGDTMTFQDDEGGDIEWHPQDEGMFLDELEKSRTLPVKVPDWLPLQARPSETIQPSGDHETDGPRPVVGSEASIWERGQLLADESRFFTARGGADSSATVSKQSVPPSEMQWSESRGPVSQDRDALGKTEANTASAQQATRVGGPSADGHSSQTATPEKAATDVERGASGASARTSWSSERASEIGVGKVRGLPPVHLSSDIGSGRPVQPPVETKLEAAETRPVSARDVPGLIVAAASAQQGFSAASADFGPDHASRLHSGSAANVQPSADTLIRGISVRAIPPDTAASAAPPSGADRDVTAKSVSDLGPAADDVDPMRSSPTDPRAIRNREPTQSNALPVFTATVLQPSRTRAATALGVRSATAAEAAIQPTAVSDQSLGNLPAIPEGDARVVKGAPPTAWPVSRQVTADEDASIRPAATATDTRRETSAASAEPGHESNAGIPNVRAQSSMPTALPGLVSESASPAAAKGVPQRGGVMDAAGLPVFMSSRRNPSEADGLQADQSRQATQSVLAGGLPFVRSPSAMSKGPAATVEDAPFLRESGRGDGDNVFTAATETSFGTHAPGQSSAASTATVISTGHFPRPEATAVLRQVAEAASRLGDGSVEIRLDPEELGRVRMIMTSSEHGLRVFIQADRPETLDLMRRNVDELARNLAEAGYEGAGFTFGDQGQRGGNSAGQESTATAAETIPTEQVTAQIQADSDGLDIRM